MVEKKNLSVEHLVLVLQEYNRIQHEHVQLGLHQDGAIFVLPSAKMNQAVSTIWIQKARQCRRHAPPMLTTEKEMPNSTPGHESSRRRRTDTVEKCQ